MSDVYRIFGAEVSPYSVKVRSYFRYKGIPHEWIVRNNSNMEEYKKYAKLPIIPAVATPEDQGLQDSTPILENLKVVYKQKPDEMAADLPRLLATGINIVGGCCGSTAEHIGLFRKLIK